VLSKDKCPSLPPVARPAFAEHDNSALPVVAVVVVVRVVQAVDDAPGCVTWAVDAVDVHRERSASHQGPAVLLTAVGVGTVGSC
jgi:hypothetical protein